MVTILLIGDDTCLAFGNIVVSAGATTVVLLENAAQHLPHIIICAKYYPSICYILSYNLQHIIVQYVTYIISVQSGKYYGPFCNRSHQTS